MESTMIQVEILQKVAIITMNNPPANAISPQFTLWLHKFYQ